MIFEQPEKAPSPILTTEVGNVIEVRDTHPLNASESIMVTDVGISTLFKLLQPEKVESAINSIEFGNVTEERLVQLANAPKSILVTEFDIDTVLNW